MQCLPEKSHERARKARKHKQPQHGKHRTYRLWFRLHSAFLNQHTLVDVTVVVRHNFKAMRERESEELTEKAATNGRKLYNKQKETLHAREPKPRRVPTRCSALQRARVDEKATKSAVYWPFDLGRKKSQKLFWARNSGPPGRDSLAKSVPARSEVAQLPLCPERDKQKNAKTLKLH